MRCPTCRGSGYEMYKAGAPCKTCHGDGAIMGAKNAVRLRRSKSETAAKQILTMLLKLTPDQRLDTLALVCNAWIEHKQINGKEHT